MKVLRSPREREPIVGSEPYLHDHVNRLKESASIYKQECKFSVVRA